MSQHDPYALPTTSVAVEPSRPPPAWIAVPLLPVVALALLIVHHLVQFQAIRIATSPDHPTIERIALFLSSIFGPAVTATLFSYPIARLYPNWTVLAALLICAPTVAQRIWSYLGVSYTPMSSAILFLHWIALMVFVPWAAAWIRRRRSSR